MKPPNIGRIICEKDSSNNVLKRYNYDTYGQLIREDNKALDKTMYTSIMIILEMLLL